MRRLQILFALLAVAALAACGTSASAPASPGGIRTVVLKGHEVDRAALLGKPSAKDLVFTEKDLEEIRGVAIRYYEEKKPERWKIFVEELRRGGIFLKDEFPGAGPNIGQWKCEAQEDGGIDLIRDPGLTPSGRPMAIYFYVHLVKQNGGWTAVYDSYREVRWRGQVPLEDDPPGG